LVILCGKQKPLVRDQQSNGDRRGKYQEEGLESDGIRNDLETLEVTDWKDRVQERDYRRTVTVAAKILKEL